MVFVPMALTVLFVLNCGCKLPSHVKEMVGVWSGRSGLPDGCAATHQTEETEAVWVYVSMSGSLSMCVSLFVCVFVCVCVCMCV